MPEASDIVQFYVFLATFVLFFRGLADIKHIFYLLGIALSWEVGFRGDLVLGKNPQHHRFR